MYVAPTPLITAFYLSNPTYAPLSISKSSARPSRPSFFHLQPKSLVNPNKHIQSLRRTIWFLTLYLSPWTWLLPFPALRLNEASHALRQSASLRQLCDAPHRGLLILDLQARGIGDLGADRLIQLLKRVSEGYQIPRRKELVVRQVGRICSKDVKLDL